MNLIPQIYAAGTGTIGVDKPQGFEITDLGKLFSSAIAVAFIIAGILVFAYLVWGGFDWLTSGGDKTKTGEAKSRITAAIVGLTIIAVSWAVIRLIAYFFGLNVFDGSITIPRPF